MCVGSEYKLTERTSLNVQQNRRAHTYISLSAQRLSIHCHGRRTAQIGHGFCCSYVPGIMGDDGVDTHYEVSAYDTLCYCAADHERRDKIGKHESPGHSSFLCFLRH